MRRLLPAPVPVFLLPLLLAFACGTRSSGPGPAAGCAAVSGCESPGTVADGADGGKATGDDDDDATSGDDDTGDAPEKPSFVDVTNETVSAGGVDRKYVLAVPKNVDKEKAYPLIFAFHGDGGNGPGLRGAFTLDDASASDAIVVYPDGLGADGKGAGWDELGPIDSNVDMPILDAIRDAVKSKYTVKDNATFGVGYSKGAFFVSRAGCVKTDFFRAIVVIAGGQPPFKTDGPDPAAYGTTSQAGPSCLKCTSHPAAMFVHGTADTTVEFQTGVYGSQCWADNNGCKNVFDAREATGPATCESYNGCDEASKVLFCPVPDAHHTDLFGRNDFVLTTRVWNFLKTFQ